MLTPRPLSPQINVYAVQCQLAFGFLHTQRHLQGLAEGGGRWSQRIAGEQGCKGQADLSLSQESKWVLSQYKTEIRAALHRMCALWKYLFTP